MRQLCFTTDLLIGEKHIALANGNIWLQPIDLKSIGFEPLKLEKYSIYHEQLPKKSRLSVFNQFIYVFEQLGGVVRQLCFTTDLLIGEKHIALANGNIWLQPIDLKSIGFEPLKLEKYSIYHEQLPKKSRLSVFNQFICVFEQLGGVVRQLCFTTDLLIGEKNIALANGNIWLQPIDLKSIGFEPLKLENIVFTMNSYQKRVDCQYLTSLSVFLNN